MDCRRSQLLQTRSWSFTRRALKAVRFSWGAASYILQICAILYDDDSELTPHSYMTLKENVFTLVPSEVVEVITQQLDDHGLQA